MAFEAPYDPRRHRRASRHLAPGRLRPLPEVLNTRHMARLRGRPTTRRPLRCTEPWLPFYTAALFRNRHQQRRRHALFDHLLQLFRERRTPGVPNRTR